MERILQAERNLPDQATGPEGASRTPALWLRGVLPDVAEEKPLALRRRYATMFNFRDALGTFIADLPDANPEGFTMDIDFENEIRDAVAAQEVQQAQRDAAARPCKCAPHGPQ